MVIANYFITPKFVFKYFDKKGANKWLFAIIGGILSEGPIYVWYPLLADLKEKGFGYGFVACFYIIGLLNYLFCQLPFIILVGNMF